MVKARGEEKEISPEGQRAPRSGLLVLEVGSGWMGRGTPPSLVSVLVMGLATASAIASARESHSQGSFGSMKTLLSSSSGSFGVSSLLST
jgi:hypothetical protein